MKMLQELQVPAPGFLLLGFGSGAGRGHGIFCFLLLSDRGFCLQCQANPLRGVELYSSGDWYVHMCARV